MYLKRCRFFRQIGEIYSSFLSVFSFLLFLFSCDFFKSFYVWNMFLFWTFLEISFKILFSRLLSSLFLLNHFSFHPFVHQLVLLFPFFFLSFFHSSFISLSPCFSFFFLLYLVFPYLFFFTAVFASFLFDFTRFSFLPFVLDLIFPTFLHLCIWFLFPETFNFFMTLCLFFWNPAFICGKSLVFSSLRRAVALCVACFSDLLFFSKLLFLIFFHQSFSLGLFKNCRLVFWKFTKNIFDFLKKKKKTKNSLLFFFLWSVFLVSLFFMQDL